MLDKEQIEAFKQTDPALFAEFVKGLLVMYQDNDINGIISMVRALDEVEPAAWGIAVLGLAQIGQAHTIVKGQTGG